jgi:hypothetical protein
MFASLISGSYSHFSYDSSATGFPDQQESANAWTLGAGLRRYLTAKTSLQPFIQLDVSRSTPTNAVGVVGGGCAPSHLDSGALTGGAEYHVTPSISIEGRAGIQGSSYSARCSGSDFSARTDSRTLSTFRSAVALNFYF